MERVNSKKGVIVYSVNRYFNEDVSINIENGAVVVNAPWFFTSNKIRKVIEEKKNIILNKIKEYEQVKEENYEMIDRKRIPTEGERLYVVGEFSIDKEKYKSSNSLGKEAVEMSDTRLMDETERDMEAQEKLLQQNKDNQ